MIAFDTSFRPGAAAGFVRAVEVLREQVAATPASHDTPLDLGALAIEFQLEAADVQRAVAVLCQESLLTFGDDDRVSVRAVSASAAKEFYDLRMAIECLVAEEAARTVKGNALYRLWDIVLDQKRILARINESETVAPADRAEFTRLAASFHLALADAVGFQLAARLVRSWEPRMRSLGLVSLEDAPRMESIVREHASILQAIDAGDTDRVRDAMKSHMQHNIERLKQ